MKPKIWVDPIVEEVRVTRAALSREVDYDLDRLSDMVIRSQERHKEKLVDRVPLRRARP